MAAEYGVAAHEQTSALERWRGYALASITPQFSWVVLPEGYGPPGVLDGVLASGYKNDSPASPALFRLRDPAPLHLDISIATESVADTPSVLPDHAGHLLDIPQAGLQRTVVAPSLAHSWGDHGSVRLTGVLAYQRFANLGMGTTASQWAPMPGWRADSSYGVGARVDVGNAYDNRVSWNLGYQSRVGMSELSNYRGVFADRGDFDIPASATANIGYALTPNFGVDIGMQRVQYSAITPFASSDLPTRFLALLGDGSSPVFKWRDLNVYSVGWTLRGDDFGSVQLRYTTRQQPIPTSALLEQALASATANDIVSLGWSRAFSANSNFSITASYATSPYYLLMPSYVSSRDGLASQFEFETLWSVRF